MIEYKEEGVPGTHLKIGPKMAEMSDQDIVELYNECLRSEAQLAAEYKRVAVEIPLNSPQIKSFAQGGFPVSQYDSGSIRGANQRQSFAIRR